MVATAIETRGLRKRFGEKVAVADLSLTVQRGEVFGFLGPNGAGKTTSLKMMLGLIEPTAGAGVVLGAPLGDRRTRARIGFLPEHFRFQDWINGRELLRFHGRLAGLSDRALDTRIEETLARVDLLDAAHRPIRTYSKGMTQRVGLAQAIIGEPELVFLDEPTSGLDPLGRRLVRDMIRQLRADGVTVFLNSHLLGEVEQTCDRVAFVKAGRTIREMRLGEGESGLDVELRMEASGEVVAGLSRFGSVSVDGRPGRVQIRVPEEGTLPGMVRWLVERGAAVYEVRQQRRGLEELFLEVMGEDQRPG
jgi:ABC-2 type transport system ATP-binding protein